MNIIFNDNSLAGQYCDLDDFVEDLNNLFLPMLMYAKKFKLEILKSYNTYSRYVTPTISLSSILNSYGSAEITAIKSYLVELSSQDPYWNDDIKTDASSQYECIFTSEIPNCFTEALERDGGLISFGKEPFCYEKIVIQRNFISHEIPNGYDRNSFLKNLFLLNVIDESCYLESISMGINIKFCSENNRKYTQDFFESNHLSKDDRIKVTEKILLLISHLYNKTDPGSLCKNFKDGLRELRSSISDDRIFRIFYTNYSSGIVFLNGFIKKSQDTPPSELALARDLAKIYRNNSM